MPRQIFLAGTHGIVFLLFVTLSSSRSVLCQDRASDTSAGGQVSTIHKSRSDQIALSHLAMAKLEQGELAEAEQLCRKVLSLVSTDPGIRSGDYAVASSNLVAVLTAKAHFIEAEKIMQQTLSLARAHLANTQFADILATRAELSLQEGRSREAIKVLKEEIKIRESLAAGAPDLERCYQNLAVAYSESGDYNRALKLIEKADAFMPTFSSDDPRALAWQNAHLVIYEEVHQRSRADRLIPDLLQSANRCLNKDPVKVAGVFTNIARIYERRHANEQAAEFFCRAYRINLQIFGESHPQTAASAMSYGAILVKLGEKEKGQTLQSQAKAALLVVR